MKIKQGLGLGLSFMLLLATSLKLTAQNQIQTYAPPTYRGKVVLVVDKTITTDSRVAAKLQRLTEDLVADGWRVLRHDVERGPEFPWDETSSEGPGYTAWAAENAYRVREIRALIKSDYDAAPNEVKNVFLLGHVPVPYSGSQSAYIVGFHFSAAFPADALYGDMLSPYGKLGWTDTNTVNAGWPFYQCNNEPMDGKFDQDVMPGPMQLGVGRLDLARMDGLEVNESTLIARYLDKDHDFRSASLQVSRRAFFALNTTRSLGIETDGAAAVFPNQVEIQSGPDSEWLWFSSVSSADGGYLVGQASSNGHQDASESIGLTATDYPAYPIGTQWDGTDGGTYGIDQSGWTSDPANNFADHDSRVVFVNMANSYMGVWDIEDDFLKAPLANPYDPQNGKFGYGLCSVFGDLGLDVTTMTKRALGATIGEALYDGYLGNVNNNLMGDPTLRLFNVLPPANVTITANTSTVNLTWTDSTDANYGYNIYRAPTASGPYTLVYSGSSPTTTSYTATRPQVGGSSYVPDNYYMIRSVKTETTAVGSYLNMSDGVTIRVPGSSVAYLAILSQPANQYPTVNTQDGTANSVAFSVDAVGCDSSGDGQVAYQWYYGNTPIKYSDPRIQGANTSSLLIKGVQPTDTGLYSVRVSIASALVGGANSFMSSPATLTVNPAFPTANPDSYTDVRNTSIDLNVLANDSTGIPGNAINLVSISPLSNVSAGNISINPDMQTVHFTPCQNFVGEVSFSYVMSDGVNRATATVSITVNPIPGAALVISAINTPPFPNQQIYAGTEVQIPFTVADNFTPLEYLKSTLTCSNPNVTCYLTGMGSQWILHVAGNFPETGATLTMSFTDWDLVSASISFQVTVLLNSSPSQPVLASPVLSPSGSALSFSIANNPNTTWTVYSSVDLTNWTPAGSVTLDGNGTGAFTDAGIANLMYKFYKLSNGTYTSHAVGFERFNLNGQGVSLADQLIRNPGSDNMLAEVFGTQLPPNTVVSKQVGTFTYLGNGNWSGGATTLNPGEGVSVNLPSGASATVTFTGIVPDGTLSVPLSSGGTYHLGSLVPLGGGLDSVLGFNPSFGDEFIQLYNGNQIIAFYDTTVSPPTWEDEYGDPIPEPVVAVGEAFYYIPANNEVWTQSYSATGGNVPKLTSEVVNADSVTFSANGDAGTAWAVYSSVDLTNWTPAGSVTLDGNGTGAFTDAGIANLMYKFYKFSNGTYTSHAIGFERFNLNGQGVSLADQLIRNPGSDNMLAEVFGTQLPPNTVVSKQVGTFTYLGNGNWSGGATTLNPGEGVSVNLPSGASAMVTFTGIVPDGTLSVPLSSGGTYHLGSLVPLGGGLDSVLGFNPSFGDEFIQLYNGNQIIAFYDTTVSPPTWEDEYGDPIPEPVVAVGDPFYYIPANNEVWTQSYSATGGNVPKLTSGVVSADSFTFSANGDANTTWTVYSSVDLTNWTPAGSVTLDGNGTGAFTDAGIANLMYKFYKFSNGTYTSHAIGFERFNLNGQGVSLADQLIRNPGSDNMLAEVFGTQLPPNTVVSKQVGTFTYLGNGNWSGGATTLNPGEGVSVNLPSGASAMVTFTGIVPDGTLSVPLSSGGTYHLGSLVPLGGGLDSVLGFNPSFGDEFIQLYNGNQIIAFYDTTVSPPTWEDEYGDPIPEPVVAVGDPFYYIPANNEVWTQSYSATGGNVPKLTSGVVSADSFTFSANGDANTTWTVYSSVDLTNWTPAGSVTLDGNGTGAFTDAGIANLMYKFYKLSNGTYTSQTIGFEQVSVSVPAPADTYGYGSLIADQLVQVPNSQNTLLSAFGQALPYGTVVRKWNGPSVSSYSSYTYNPNVYSDKGGWSGMASLNPGEAVFVELPSGSPTTTVAFVGLVPEGQLVMPFANGGSYLVSSMLPQAGGISSVLGFNPGLGGQVMLWQNGSMTTVLYDPLSLDPGASPTGWIAGDNSTIIPEPVLNVGDAFYVVPSSNQEWTQLYMPNPITPSYPTTQ